MAFVPPPTTTGTALGHIASQGFSPEVVVQQLSAGTIDAVDVDLSGNLAAADATVTGAVVGTGAVTFSGNITAPLPTPYDATTLTAVTGAGTTYTAAQVVLGYVSRTSSAAVTDTLPTVAQLIAEVGAEAVVGTTYEFRVLNQNTTLGYTVTVAPGTGWTYVPAHGNAVVREVGHQVHFTLHLTNVSSGSEAGNLFPRFVRGYLSTITRYWFDTLLLGDMSPAGTYPGYPYPMLAFNARALRVTSNVIIRDLGAADPATLDFDAVFRGGFIRGTPPTNPTVLNTGTAAAIVANTPLTPELTWPVVIINESETNAYTLTINTNVVIYGSTTIPPKESRTYYFQRFHNIGQTYIDIFAKS